MAKTKSHYCLIDKVLQPLQHLTPFSSKSQKLKNSLLPQLHATFCETQLQHLCSVYENVSPKTPKLSAFSLGRTVYTLIEKLLASCHSRVQCFLRVPTQKEIVRGSHTDVFFRKVWASRFEPFEVR